MVLALGYDIVGGEFRVRNPYRKFFFYQNEMRSNIEYGHDCLSSIFNVIIDKKNIASCQNIGQAMSTATQAEHAN